MAKNKKDEKKKKKKGPPWLLIILILLLLLIGGIGFGMGWFEGDGDGEGSTDVSSVADNSVNDDSKADDSSSAEKTTVTVKISGDKYVYEDAELTLEDLKGKLQGLDKETTIVEVTDDNAVANAVTSLKEMLESLGLSFTGIS